MFLSAAQTQTSNFMNLEHEAYLSLQRLSVALGYEAAELFKEHGLSAPQFNILRILRGAAGEDTAHPGLSAHEIGERLLVHAPDLTRLLDRMSTQGLVTRCRATGDRRIVTTRLTEKGRTLLAELDAPLKALHTRQFAGLSEAQLRWLLDLLKAFRIQSPPQQGDAL